MKTYLDNESGLLTLQPGDKQGIKKLDAKGDTFVLQIVPSVALTGATGILAAKPDGIYSGVPVLLDAAWDAPTDPDTTYTFNLDLTSSEFLALFTGEIPQVILMAEVIWTLDGKVRRTQTFQIICARSVYLLTDITPHPTEAMPSFKLSSPDSSQWTISITNDGQIERSKL